MKALTMLNKVTLEAMLLDLSQPMAQLQIKM
jgi:hypothetical protein